MQHSFWGKNIKLKMITAHLGGWVLYLFFVFGTAILARPEVGFRDILFYIVPFVIAFYLSLYCLNLYKQKGVWWSIASSFIVFAVMASAGYLYVYKILPALGMVLYTSEKFSIFLVEAVLGYIRVFSFALIYFYLEQLFEKEHSLRKLHEEKAAKELENAYLREQELKAQKEKLQFEQAVLRAQINPHFLHNTLNTLFSQALDYSPELADNILKLSHLMRYSIESLDFENGKVNVQREIDNLQTLIDIHNLRFRGQGTVHLEISGEMIGQGVPPLSFITLVENVFKYGDMRDPKNPVVIKVTLRANEVHFYCKNKIRSDRVATTSYNIGLTNLRRRLDATFKGCHVLHISKRDGTYIADLTLKTPANVELLRH